jgi:hypothetical protein
MYVCMYVCMYVYSEQDNKNGLMSLSEETTGGGRERKKMLENEKY